MQSANSIQFKVQTLYQSFHHMETLIELKDRRQHLLLLGSGVKSLPFHLFSCHFLPENFVADNLTSDHLTDKCTRKMK